MSVFRVKLKIENVGAFFDDIFFSTKEKAEDYAKKVMSDKNRFTRWDGTPLTISGYEIEETEK